MRSSKLAEAAALLQAFDEADDEATDADYAWSGLPSDPPGAEQRFHEACARLREIRDCLFMLNVHAGGAVKH
jgi:hypothetical protein